MDYEFLKTSRAAPAEAGRDFPPELRRWNWGAFFLNVLWGMGNNVWIALLTLLPVIGLFMPFFLGANGNAWAWKNGHWESVEQFKRVQRRWAIAGFLVAGAMLLIVLSPFIAIPAFKAQMSAPIRARVLVVLANSPEAIALLGSPVVESKSGGMRESASYGADYFDVRLNVSGPKGQAHVEARGRRVQGEWMVDSMTLRLPAGGTALQILPRQRL